MFSTASQKRFFAVTTIALASIAAVGCESNKRYSSGNDAIKVAVKPSQRTVYTGETVTVFSKTENTLGRDAELKWRSTGGKLTTEEKGRIARVVFEQAGTYSVDAILVVDGKEIKRDTTVVEVQPLPN